MTVICAWVDESRAVMLGDSCVSEGGVRIVSRSPKVSVAGQWLVGAAGDAGACTALLAARIPTEPRRMLEVLAEVDGDWDALLARPGELWVASSGGELEQLPGPWWAIGSGGEIALGALAALRRRTPEATLRAAAGIVARLRSDVCGPMCVVEKRARPEK